MDEFCKQHRMLAAFKRPRFYRFVDTLPMTATGKKVHYKVRAQVEKDHADGLLEKV
jgi:acyl-coenzyme A synthetase/AMP-(fatty) acid ligase